MPCCPPQTACIVCCCGLQVRTKEELQSVAGLIIPGESRARCSLLAAALERCVGRWKPGLDLPVAGPHAGACKHPTTCTLCSLLGPFPMILAGGESTTMALVAERWGLIPELRQFAAEQRPIWGTCAGLIFLANRASGAWLPCCALTRLFKLAWHDGGRAEIREHASVGQPVAAGSACTQLPCMLLLVLQACADACLYSDG